MRLTVYCADVGSIKQGNFGWARADVPAHEIDRHRGGTEIVELVEAVADDLAAHHHVALGFECPLFVPVPEEARRLGAARLGESNRSWSAGAGTGALTTGLVQAGWILRQLRERRPNDEVFLDWSAFRAARRGLFLWEAFVTDRAKAATHFDDATIAVTSFVDALPEPDQRNAIEAETPISLIGAAAVWSGWSSETGMLSRACLVLKAAAELQIR
jgi:hypothetical protein